MPHPFPLASAFTGGMRRDIDRTEIPGGSAYNMIDFIPDEVQAVNAGRGGWTYAGAALTGATGINIVSYHPDLGKIIAMDTQSTPKIWDVAGATAYTSTLTNYRSCFAPPTYHRGYLIFGSQSNGFNFQAPVILKDDGTVGSLSSAPLGLIPGVYKDHALLARIQTTNPRLTDHINRLYFSAAGDPTTWDTSFGWWDTTGAIMALGCLPNCVLIFHPDSTERLRGTTPPPGSDMTLEPFLPNVGCVDPFSVAYWNNNVIFASSQGIYMTNGTGSIDLTDGADLKTYWQSIMAGALRITGGIYRDHYIVSLNNGSTLVDCLCFSLKNQTAWRFTNLHGSSFVNVTTGTQEKCYMGQNNAGRVAELSSLWSPSSTVKQDGDGTNPTPIVETAMFRGYDRLHRRWIESMGKQKWRFAYVDYDLRDAASDNPTAAISYCTTPTGSYTQAGLSLSETTDYKRVRRSLSPTQGGGTHSNMLGLKFAVTGPYAAAKLYTLEGDFSPMEIGAL